MTILFVGSSPSDLGGSVQPNTTTNGRDPNFTPVGSSAYVPNALADSGESFTIHTAPSTDYWLHFKVKTGRFDSGVNADGYWIRFWDGNDLVAMYDLNNGIQRLVGDPDGVNTIKVISSLSNTTEYTIDFHISQSGGDVILDLYTGGILYDTLTWTPGSLPAGVDKVTFDHYDIDSSFDPPLDFYYSEVIVTDGEPTLGWRLSTLTPAADGNYTDWQGDYQSIEEANDGLQISTGYVNQKQSWTLSAYGGPASPTSVRALVNKIRGSKGATGPQTIIPFVRAGGTDYSSAGYNPDGADELVVLDNNPDTGLAWNPATDLATLEIGVKSDT